MHISMKRIGLIFVTPIFILLSHYLSVFPHEYAHSFAAWLLGHKNSPFDLNYGGTALSNILLLMNIDQNVDNKMIYALGYPSHVGIIALAGIVMNLLLLIFSFQMLKLYAVKQRPYLFYFLFFLNLMNLGSLFAYIPIRIFATQTNMLDIVDVEQAFGISPWWIYSICGYLMAFLIWQFFTQTLVTAYIILKIQNLFLKAGLMIICVVILFAYFGIAGFFSHGGVPYFLSATSLLAVPGIILLLWPTRYGVRQQLATLAKN